MLATGFRPPDEPIRARLTLLWSTVGLIILISIVLHGVTVTPVMRRLDRRRTGSWPEQLPRPAQIAGE
jgi:NhaP-type Na+/H+ or K+/H+ antiporter